MTHPPFQPPRPSQTKIVATVGPACESRQQLIELLLAGVDVFRINMAHGKPADQEPRLETIRAASEATGHPVAVLADLAGPKIRLGELPGDQLTLDADDTVCFVRVPQDSLQDTARPRPSKDGITLHQEGGSVYHLTTNYLPLVDELQPGDRVMLADGTVSLEVEAVDANMARCHVVQPGLIRSRQGVNLPGVKLSAPALGPEDRENAIWAAKAGIDFVGLSFVRAPEEILALKALLAEHGSAARVIAKIEKPEAVAQLEAIVEATDGVMVARGDLGVEIDIATVAVVQKRIIAQCNRRRKPVIVATQMLDSMQHSRVPTRAEVADVANAILDGADACMLSGETAVGRFPRQAVEMMHRIALATEPLCRNLPRPRLPDLKGHGINPITETTVFAAGRMAEELDAKLVVVASATGATALSMAKNRNWVPTLGVSDSPETLRRMCLYWGMIPLAGAPM
ncbi:MAG: pyruvate kinase, partial [Patescibacteria group bacterium]|nr:pyruvate kinase [Patescibacteria group bacterium]